MIEGILLIGCGKMGSALLKGWQQAKIAKICHIVEPNAQLHPAASDSIKIYTDMAQIADGCKISIVVLALKPQVMDDVLGQYQDLVRKQNARVLSIAAGKTIGFFEQFFGSDCPIVRSMPNTPCAVGAGISAIVGNGACSDDDLALARDLLSGVGEVVTLQDEAQMDAVTGLSGSGPAYVFYMIDAMADAGVALGLPVDLAMKLAKHTVFGAGKLALQSDDSPQQLRINVTSPGGTTKAGLDVLMEGSQGLHQLMASTINAATQRSKELAG